MYNKNSLSIYIILILIMLTSAQLIHSEEIEEKFLPFILTEEEMPRYELKQLLDGTWAISENKSLKIKMQDWSGKDGDLHNRFSITICVFDSEYEAIRGVEYSLSVCSTPHYWGSFNGSIVGEDSWIDDMRGTIYDIKQQSIFFEAI